MWSLWLQWPFVSVIFLFAISASPVTMADEVDVTCYSCVYSYHPTAVDTCVTNPTNSTPPLTVRCHHSRVCTVTTMWDKAEKVMRSFTRGCELRQDRVESCVEDLHFTTCWSFCRMQLCNARLHRVRQPGVLPPTAADRSASGNHGSATRKRPRARARSDAAITCSTHSTPFYSSCGALLSVLLRTFLLQF